MVETRDPEPSLGRLEQTLEQDWIEPEKKKGQPGNRTKKKEDKDESAGELYLDKSLYFLRCFVCF